MTGSMHQIHAVSLQDKVVTGNPTRSFFQFSYRRHTPFAQEPKEIGLNGQQDWGKTAHAIIPRSGDLLAKLYLVVDLGNLNDGNGGAGVHYVDDVGRAMLEYVSIEMGSVEFAKIYPEFMHAWEELSVPKERHFGRLTGKTSCDATREVWARNTQRLYIPLEFWFQRNYGSALPLVALHLTDIRINIKLKNKVDVISKTYDTSDAARLAKDAVIEQMFLVGEYIYLDDAERSTIAQSKMQQLISQVQMESAGAKAQDPSLSMQLRFNHPTKEFIVVARTQENTDDKEWFNFAGYETGRYAEEAFDQMAVVLNNNDRVKYRDPLYYRIVQPYEHHTRVPDKHIYVYSLAIAPEAHAPSGSINLSRIEDCRLVFKFGERLKEAMEFFVFVTSINTVTYADGVATLSWSS